MSDLYQQYLDKRYKISALRLVLGISQVDSETIAPTKGADYRNDRFGYVSGMIFDLEIEDELYDIMKKIVEDKSIDEEKRQIVAWNLRDVEKIKLIPKDVFVENSILQMKSQQAWVKAKQNNDYSLFKPYLLQIIEMQKKIISYRDNNNRGYDVLLDDYEPGMTMAKYDEFFNLIKEKLVPLIKEINAKQIINDDFVYQNYPVDKQEKLMKEIMKFIDFDFDSGVLELSEHPFTSSFCKGDGRITTHYYENSLVSSIYSVIHEAGHANYNAQVRDDLAETYVFDNISSGMHESQSRLFENYLARRFHFWDQLFGKVKELFPQQLKDVDQDAFVKAVNKAGSSLIRTDADELTYPLHILIRYEIEKGIFDGSIDLDKLDQIWDEKYEQYLGIKAKEVRDGILQDIHWSGGSFGYFPTYALGSAYSAQFMKAMEKDIDVDKLLSEGKFKDIKEWLKEKIHQYGGLNYPRQQIIMATGEDFNPNYYIDYLTNKYRKLYNID